MGISRSHGDFNHSFFGCCIWRVENISRHLQRRKTLNRHSENARCGFYWQFVDGWSMTKKKKQKHKHPKKKVSGSLPQGCLWFAEKDLEERKCIYCMYIFVLIVGGPKLPASNWLSSRFASVACFLFCISLKTGNCCHRRTPQRFLAAKVRAFQLSTSSFLFATAMYWRCTWCSTGPAFQEFQSSNNIRTSASRPTTLAAFCGERLSNWVRISLRA